MNTTLTKEQQKRLISTRQWSNEQFIKLVCSEETWKAEEALKNPYFPKEKEVYLKCYKAPSNTVREFIAKNTDIGFILKFLACDSNWYVAKIAFDNQNLPKLEDDLIYYAENSSYEELRVYAVRTITKRSKLREYLCSSNDKIAEAALRNPNLPKGEDDLHYYFENATYSGALELVAEKCKSPTIIRKIVCGNNEKASQTAIERNPNLPLDIESLEMYAKGNKYARMLAAKYATNLVELACDEVREVAIKALNSLFIPTDEKSLEKYAQAKCIETRIFAAQKTTVKTTIIRLMADENSAVVQAALSNPNKPTINEVFELVFD